MSKKDKQKSREQKNTLERQGVSKRETEKNRGTDRGTDEKGKIFEPGSVNPASTRQNLWQSQPVC